MWYNKGHESTHFYSTTDSRRTQADAGGLAFVGRLRVATLPNPAGFCPRGARFDDRQTPGLRRPDRSQCNQRLQCNRTRRAQRGVFASPSTPHDLLPRSGQAVESTLAPQPPRLWPRPWSVDVGTGGQDQFRAGDYPPHNVGGERAPGAPKHRDQLEASQTLDYQPRSPVPAKKTHAIG